MSKAKPKGTPEVHSARSKLDGVLQTLVTKKEESPIEDDIKEEEMGEDPTTQWTPKKSAQGKSSRKRKRGKDEGISPELGEYHHTFVMKLFERSVDLAQFNESTPLYPVCRAWMRNQPHNRHLGPRDRSPTPEPEHDYSDDEEGRDVYKLPPPIVIKLECGMLPSDMRVPSPVPQPDETLDIHADPETAPAPEQILLNHMVRWKQIRHKWKEAGYRHESKSIESLQILKNMYEQQLKEQG